LFKVSRLAAFYQLALEGCDWTFDTYDDVVGMDMTDGKAVLGRPSGRPDEGPKYSDTKPIFGRR
jgi:hypothetical protein